MIAIFIIAYARVYRKTTQCRGRFYRSAKYLFLDQPLFAHGAETSQERRADAGK